MQQPAAPEIERRNIEDGDLPRPSGGSEAPLGADIPQARGFDLPKTPAEFRRALRLPEPIPILPREDYQKKKDMVERYVVQQTAIIPRNRFAQGEQNLDYTDREIRRQLADQSFSTRLWRGWMRQRLGWLGVRHGEKVLQAIEGSTQIFYRKDLQPAALVRLIKALDPENEVEAVRKLNVAIERGRQFYCIPTSHDFRDYPDELVDFIAVLANTPEDTYQRIYHQFDGQRSVIFNTDSFCKGYGVPERNGLLQIFKQGGLTAEQQQTLTRAVVWQQFSDALPFSLDPKVDRSYQFWLGYNDLLNPVVSQQLDKYYPYLVDWASHSPKVLHARRPPTGGEETCDGRDFTVAIQHLDSTGKLIFLNNLMSAGWNCQGIYKAMDRVVYNTDPTRQYTGIDQALSQAAAFQSDPEKVAWVKALNEYYYGVTTLGSTGVPIYEEEIKNKDVLVTIALILNALPKQDGFKAGNFLILKNGEVGINRQELSYYLRDLIARPDITEFDRRYAEGLITLLSEEGRKDLPQCLSIEKLPIYLYLAVNKDRAVNQMFNGGGGLAARAALLNELASQGVPIEGQLMKRLVASCPDQALLSPNLKFAYFDGLRQDFRAEALTTLPDEFLATLPEKEQALIVFFRQLPASLQDKFVGSKKVLMSFIENGQLTAVFAKYALNNGFFEEAKQVLTPEAISSFAPSERQFFQTCLSLPPDVVRLMQGYQAQWGSYLIDGKPTPAFLQRATGSSNRGRIDQLLAVTDLSSFSPSEQAFWNFYKSIPQKPHMRACLLRAADKFSQLVDCGQPTLVFLESVAQAAEVDTLREVLPYFRTSDLPPEQQAFWSFYPSLDQNQSAAIRNYLLERRDQFSQLIEGGKPTLTFLDQAASAVASQFNVVLIEQILNMIDWDKIPAEERVFWRYYSSHAAAFHVVISADFLLRNKARFPQMVVEGQETPLFYQILIREEPRTMLDLPNRVTGLSARQYQDHWRWALGSEVVDKFLAVLPKATDEARNAFTNNEYDRASKFIRYLMDRMLADRFGLSTAEFSTMTAYVYQFGLARNEMIYKYYRDLFLFERRQTLDLPEEIRALGISSTAEMIQKISEVRKMVFGERQLADAGELRSLTPFQVQMLANVTRFDSSRWGSGDASRLSWKINQFADSLEQGLITPLPSGYGPESIGASSIKIEFNAEAVRKDYEILKGEILECIDHPPTADQLKGAVRLVIGKRMEKINQSLSKVTNEKAAAAIARDLARYQSYLSQAEKAEGTDSLTLSLLGMSFSNEDRLGGEGFIGIDAVMRRVILSKLYHGSNRSPGFLEDVRIKLSKDEITAEGIDEIILTVDEMIKNHVLNLDQGNREKYWQSEVFEAIIKDNALRKSFRRITERFNPHAEKLRQEQARFVKTQTGKVTKVRTIPDRGLIGEMAGYLADVCYVNVEDLLKTYSGESGYPLVVPYKFIANSPDSGDPEFVGSVLVFEVQTAKGEPALLVRALDIPNEGEIDISKFTEEFLDKLVEVADKRGKKKVLVAGTGGTISNYPAVTNHIIGKYVQGKDPEPVSPDFDFNGYNITQSIYTARTI